MWVLQGAFRNLGAAWPSAVLPAQGTASFSVWALQLSKQQTEVGDTVLQQGTAARGHQLSCPDQS